MTIYDIFFFIFSIIYLPYLVIKGKAHKNFKERLGILPPAFKGIGTLRPVWVHAVSVGEVLAVKNFVDKLEARFPEKKIIISTTTKTGNSVAKSTFGENILKFYFPLDFSFTVRRVLNLINPSLFIVMETEIWPNLILGLSKRNIPITLINGRISDRSFKGYNRIKFFFGDIVRKISLACMRSERDAKNIEALGARKENIKITGNMKFDIEEAGSKKESLSKLNLGIEESSDLLVAGSTHGNENEIVLDVYKELKKNLDNPRLLIAPRHIDKALAIKKLVEERGFEGVFFSRLKSGTKRLVSKNAVIILDTYGELGSLYSLATVVFMGGSLVKRGGHNIVEPALFGKPIVFGGFMFNFKEMAKSFLENNAAIKVKDKDELLSTLKSLFTDKNRRIVLGRNAKELMENSKGATERNATLISELIKREAVI